MKIMRKHLEIKALTAYDCGTYFYLVSTNDYTKGWGHNGSKKRLVGSNLLCWNTITSGVWELQGK